MGKAPAEMTVAVIKKELEARGLDTKGLKGELVERLERAITGQGGEGSSSSSSSSGGSSAASGLGSAQ